MTNLSPTVLDVLHDHRDSIDRLDAILIYTLGERFRHTKAIGLSLIHISEPTRH